MFSSLFLSKGIGIGSYYRCLKDIFSYQNTVRTAILTDTKILLRVFCVWMICVPKNLLATVLRYERNFSSHYC